MQKHTLCAAAAIPLAFFAALASAITMESAITQGGTVVTDFSATSLVSFTSTSKALRPR